MRVLLIFALLLSNIYAVGYIDYSDLKKIGDRYYNSPKKPFEGIAIKFYSDGTKWHETSFKNGIKHGVYRAFWRNGKVQYEGRYNYGEKDGLYRQWWDNGQLKLEMIFKNGKRVE